MTTKFSDLPLHTFGHSVQMAGAVYVGGGRSFLFTFPDDALEGELETVPMSLDDWKELVRQTDMLDMELLVRQPDGSVKKAIYRKSERQVDQNVTWAVFRRDGYSCRYCGKDGVPLTVDHLILHHEGGPSVEANLLSACRKCNKVRGDIQYADWLQHPFYVERAKGLSPAVREQNVAMAAGLDKVHRVKVKTR
jgi:hypothetical protein